MREQLHAATEAAVERLRRAGKLLPVRLQPPELPRPFAEALGRVLALEADSPRKATLETHYLSLMPAMRVEQLASSEAPASRFFQAPLRWDNLPHLSQAVARLRALLDEAGAPAPDLGGDTVGELYQRTFYGGFMPLLYGAPADLAHFARAGLPLDDTLDLYLTAPLVHELAHLHRARRVFPLYLDECVAGALGVRVFPQFAFPDGDEGIFATPWFAQVGQALARAAGWRNLVRAHAGIVPWADALPPGLAAALERLGWEDYVESRRLHLLSDNFHPEPWLKAIFLGQAGVSLERHTLRSLAALPWSEVPPGDDSPLDEEVVRHALLSMCLDNHQVERSFRTRLRPPPSPIEVSAANCRMSTAPGPFDPVPLAYFLPPPLAARLPHDCVITLRDLGAVDELSRVILDGAAPREAPGYTLISRPRPARPGSAA